jgi:hypothetical protein
MSAPIWTLCGGKSKLGSLNLNAWRIVEDQSRCSTMKLTRSSAEQAVLEDILEDRKPAFPFPPYQKTLHYLLWTPFRYPPLRNGSRFGTRLEVSIWYGSEAVETALAEKAYYRFVFHEGMTVPFQDSIENKYTAFCASVKASQAVDLSARSFADYHPIIESKIDYSHTQQLGGAMRADGVDAFVFGSARDKNRGRNIGLFHPAVFSGTEPKQQMLWHSFETRGHMRFYRAVPGQERTMEFEMGEFMVDDRLPMPAL